MRFLCLLALSCVFGAGCASVPVITPTEAASAPTSTPAPTGSEGTADVALATGTGSSSTSSGSTPADTSEPQAAVAAAEVDAAEVEVTHQDAVPDMSREDAITLLSEVAFMSFGDASCVIDALYAEVGVYNFTSQKAIEQADQPALIETCLNGGQPVPRTSVDSGAPATAADAGGSAVANSASSNVAVPRLLPEGITKSSVVVGGQTVLYEAITPEGFAVGDSAPVFIFLHEHDEFSDGSSYAQSLFLTHAQVRGWVVISPAAVAGTWHDKRNADMLPEFVRWLESWIAIDGGSPHLGGSRTGAVAAYKLAADQPATFQSLMIFPGLMPQPHAEYAAKLAPLRVRLWGIDVADSPWLPGMIESETALLATGTDARLHTLSFDDLVGLDDAGYGLLIFNELVTAQQQQRP